jgi:hypothetical protein
LFLQLSLSSQVYRLGERDLATRLELLFKRNMYSLALSLVQSEQQAALLGLPGADRAVIDMDPSDANDRLSFPYDYNIVTEIHKRYGDWLYVKGDHDAAMIEYCQTIPYLESSYVIRRYLDVQKMDLLAKYLEALHDKAAATPDHTTLLLNCYAKARDAAKLDAFLNGGGKELPFDVDTAITVCRSAGYHKQALDLARRYLHHDSAVRIQVEDLRTYNDAMDYISGLAFGDAAALMVRYGGVLVDQVPEHATEVLTRLCTGWYPIVRARRETSPVALVQDDDRPRSALATGLGISSRSGKGTPASSRPATPSTFAQDSISGMRSGLDRIVSAASAALPIPGGRSRTPAGAAKGGTTPTASPSPMVSSSLPASGLRPSSWASPSPLGPAGDLALADDRDALFSRKDSSRSYAPPPSTASLPRANAGEFIQLFAGQSKVLSPPTTGEDGMTHVAPTLTAEQVATKDEIKTKYCVKFLELVLERRGKGKLYSASEVERSLTSQGGVQMVGLDEAETGLVLDGASFKNAEDESGVEVENKVLWNTLLELYLGGTIIGTLVVDKERSLTPSGAELSTTPGSLGHRRNLSAGAVSSTSNNSRPKSPSVVEDWKTKAMSLLKDPNVGLWAF